MDIIQNLLSIKKQIHDYEKRYHREPDSVFLLAVSKKQPVEKIQRAIEGGQRAFGENYLQEALDKITKIADSQIEWHFIGSIQSNKTKKIAEHFNWVHSVSEKKIAQRLNDQRPDYLPPLNICLEVNVSLESSKSGVMITDVLALAEFCASLPQLKLRGLMTIPKPNTHLDAQRAEFHKLKLLFDELNSKNFKLDTLSMGMSDDMQAAIAEGSTMVRIGTAIFGARAG